MATHEGAGVSTGNVDRGRNIIVLRGQLCCNTEELLSVEESKQGCFLENTICCTQHRSFRTKKPLKEVT